MTRNAAIIVCSCGQKYGNAERAALHEDLAMVERALLSTYVSRMVRHWRLGHRLTCQAPAFADVIVTVAARMAAAEAGDEPVEPAGLLESA